MKMKLMGAAFAAALLAIPVATSAQVSVGVVVAPPAARYEAVPPARAGWVWERGHWSWHNGRYVWVRGYWVAARAGWRWVPGEWGPRAGRWYWVPGHWARV